MNDKIQCLLCNNFYGTIVSSHLERRHKISKVDYLKRFPDARLFSEKYSANRKKVFLDVIKNNPDICSKAGKKGIISTNKYLHGVYRKRFPEKYHAHHIKVGKITKAQLREIAEKKMPDLNTTDIEQAIKIIAGTAKNMGVDVVG